ncbi:MAG: hypothetical protein V1735_00175 [Nanoarchaeota archaeon]
MGVEQLGSLLLEYSRLIQIPFKAIVPQPGFEVCQEFTLGLLSRKEVDDKGIAKQNHTFPFREPLKHGQRNGARRLNIFPPRGLGGKQVFPKRKAYKSIKNPLNHDQPGQEP